MLKRFSVAIFVVTVVFFSWADQIAAQSQTVTVKKDAPVTLMVAANVYQRSEISRSINRMLTISSDPSGKLLLNGRADWKAAGLPLLIDGKVFNVTKSKGSRGESVSIPIAPKDGSLIFLRFDPSVTDVDAALRAIAPDHATAVAEAAALAAAMQTTLKGAPLSLSDAQANAVLAFVTAKDGSGAASQRFKEIDYLSLDLGVSSSVYNDLQIRDASQRVNKLISVQGTTDLKDAAKLTLPDSVKGIKLTYRIGHMSFSINGGPITEDVVDLYVPMTALRKFVGADISVQDLVKSIIAIVNGDRVDL